MIDNNVYNDMNNSVLDVPQLRVNRILGIPSKRYNDVYRRPYEMQADSSTLRNLENLVGYQREKNISMNAVALASAVPEIMRLSNTAGKRVDIAEGWNTTKLRFILEVESDFNGGVMVSYIQGYTDYYDPSAMGRVDPNMPMHINSITNVIRTVTDTGQVLTRVHSTFNVLYDPYSQSYSIDSNISDRTLRPKDIVNGMDNLHRYDHSLNPNDPVGGLIDYRTAYGYAPIESKRLNGIGVQHVSDVINSLSLGKNMGDIGYNASDIYNISASDLEENSISKVPFIEAIRSITGDPSRIDFSLNLLTNFRPDIENILTISDNTGPMIREVNILDSEHTERLDGSNMETNIAATISESVNALIVEEMLSKVSFQVTNMTPNSETVIIPTDVKSFIHGIDITVYAERFFSKFKAMVMPIITQHNLIGVDIVISADIIGDTTIAVGLNGNSPVIFRLPTFCNSLYTSVIGDDNQFNVLVEDFSSIANAANIRI